MALVPTKRKRKITREPLITGIRITEVSNKQPDTYTKNVYVGSRLFTYIENISKSTKFYEFVQECFDIANGIKTTYHKDSTFPVVDITSGLLIFLLDENGIPQPYLDEKVKFYKYNSTDEPLFEPIMYTIENNELSTIIFDVVSLETFITDKDFKCDIQFDPQFSDENEKAASLFNHYGTILSDVDLENISRCLAVANRACTRILTQLANPLTKTVEINPHNFKVLDRFFVPQFKNNSSSSNLKITAKMRSISMPYNSFLNSQNNYLFNGIASSNMAIEAITDSMIQSAATSSLIQPRIQIDSLPFIIQP